MDLQEKGEEDSFVILDGPESMIDEKASGAFKNENKTILESNDQSIASTKNLLHNKAIMSSSQTATSAKLTASVTASTAEVTALPLDAVAVQANETTMELPLDAPKVVAVQTPTETPIDFVPNNETIMSTSEAVEVVIEKPLSNLVNSVNSFEKIVKTDGLNTSMRSTGSDKMSSLAASYILGEVKADVLTSNIYSQYPSVNSIAACAEDAWKIQMLSKDRSSLRDSLEKVTERLTIVHDRVLEWKEYTKVKETDYKQQIECFQKQIEIYRNENVELKREIQEKINEMKGCDELLQKQQNDMEKNVSVMQAQIEKQQDQGQNFKEQLSVVVAENFELKDMQTQYIDEINCLKVNLTSAEELIKKTHAELNVLKANDIERETENKNLRDDLLLLRQQVDIYGKDFETERNERQSLAGEKDQLLQDLRALQRQNQKLIEQAQITLQDYEHHIQNQPVVENVNQINENNQESTPLRTFSCPVCLKNFESLIILQEHVNGCLDQT